MVTTTIPKNFKQKRKHKFMGSHLEFRLSRNILGNLSFHPQHLFSSLCPVLLKLALPPVMINPGACNWHSTMWEDPTERNERLPKILPGLAQATWVALRAAFRVNFTPAAEENRGAVTKTGQELVDRTTEWMPSGAPARELSEATSAIHTAAPVHRDEANTGSATMSSSFLEPEKREQTYPKWVN